ncbi:RteC domain-containing protein [Aestuariivivens sediminis]|uniref:RteC domain-containing protein n=1 Tax=Aestuariivivens sediminis TaxID=2913557 RepID=UPI001F57659A|nr:RteC domain-containing protein [Aestuariivivens sediminis]
MNTLITTFKKDIETIASQETNLITQTEKKILCCQNALYRLEQIVLSHTFKDVMEEVRVFKEFKPCIVSEWIFTKQYFKVQSQWPLGSKKTKIKYLNQHLAHYQKYLTEHLEFYTHCRRNDPKLDVLYFTRDHYKPCLRAEPYMFVNSPSFSTSHDITLATLLAYEQLIDTLQEALEALQSDLPGGPPKSLKQPPQLKWTGTKTELVEIIYALHVSGMLNHGQGDVIYAVRVFETLFGESLENFHQLVSNIRHRSRSRTIALDKLADTLEHHIALADGMD